MSIDVIDHPDRHPISGRDHDVDIVTNSFGPLLNRLFRSIQLFELCAQFIGVALPGDCGFSARRIAIERKRLKFIIPWPCGREVGKGGTIGIAHNLPVDVPEAQNHRAIPADLGHDLDSILGIKH